MFNYIKYAEIIVSILLIVLIVLQSKGAGLSLNPGAGDFAKFERRGAERTFHFITIGLGILFVVLAIAAFYAR